MAFTMNDLVRLSEMDGSATSVTIDPSSWSSAMRGKVIKMLRLASVIGGHSSKAATVVEALAMEYRLNFMFSYDSTTVSKHGIPKKIVQEISDEITASATSLRISGAGNNHHIAAAAKQAIDNLVTQHYLAYGFSSPERAERVRKLIVRSLPDKEMQAIEALCEQIKAGTNFTFTIRN
jgi:hypothetical protein